MTAKKPDNLFTITPLAQGFGLHSAGGITPAGSNRPLTTAEKRSSDEFQKQLLVIEQQHQKTRVGQRAVTSLRHSAAATFIENAEAIWSLKSVAGRDPQLQMFIDTYCIQQVKLSGVFLDEVSTIGIERILQEVGRSTYFATEEERHSFFARLFGASNGR